MAMFMSRIRTISLAFVVATVNLAAVAGTNAAVMAAAKCPQATSANAGVLVSDTAVSRELKAEVKEAATAAEAQYKDRYKELKDAHDRFMCYMDILIGVATILVTIFGVVFPLIKQRRFEKEIVGYRKSLAYVHTMSMHLKETQAKASMNLMKFVWVEFLHVITSGGYDNRDRDRDIAQPIYRIVEALTFSYKLGDDKVLKSCLADVATIVSRYQEVVKDKKDLDNAFKEFITNHRICTDSFDVYDLVKATGKTPTLEKVLKFLNEFGITMFGEVCG